MKVSYPESHITLRWSHDKLIKLYRHFHKTYGHYTWQVADLRGLVQSSKAQVVTDFFFLACGWFQTHCSYTVYSFKKLPITNWNY